MSTERNKAVVQRYYEEVLNQGHLETLAHIAVADYREHAPLPGQADGRTGLQQRVELLRSAFQPVFILEDIIAEDDKVVVRWTHQGTHQGAFLGIPPTGKSFTITGIDIHALRDGQLAEHWDVVDQLSLLQQLGLVPQPGGNGH